MQLDQDFFSIDYTFAVLEDEIIERTFQFTLSQPCEVKCLGNSQEIVFITEEKGGKKFLTGFLLTIKDTTES
jgi:hypothetical protein